MITLSIDQDGPGYITFHIAHVGPIILGLLGQMDLYAKGWKLARMMVPEIRLGEKLLFLWGANQSRNSQPLYLPQDEFKSLVESFKDFSLPITLHDQFFGLESKEPASFDLIQVVNPPAPLSKWV
jgi:hypothetical protein